jgi:hypothetical protein
MARASASTDRKKTGRKWVRADREPVFGTARAGELVALDGMMEVGERAAEWWGRSFDRRAFALDFAGLSIY